MTVWQSVRSTGEPYIQSWSSWQLASTVTHAHPHSSTVDNYLCGIALGPLASYTVVFFATCCVLLSNAADQWIMGVAVGEKGTDWEQDFWNGQSRAPVVLENVQADHPLAVDVAVVDACAENYLQNYRTRKENLSGATCLYFRYDFEGSGLSLVILYFTMQWTSASRHICIKKQNKNKMYCTLISAVLILVVKWTKTFYTKVYISTLLQSFPLSPLFVRHTHTPTPTLQPQNPWLPHFFTLWPPHLEQSPKTSGTHSATLCSKANSWQFSAYFS